MKNSGRCTIVLSLGGLGSLCSVQTCQQVYSLSWIPAVLLGDVEYTITYKEIWVQKEKMSSPQNPFGQTLECI